MLVANKADLFENEAVTEEEGQELAPRLLDRKIPNFEIRWVEGADHEFTGMVDEFVSLIDLV